MNINKWRFKIKYLYNVTYHEQEDELCSLELRSLFGFQLEKNIFFSDKNYDPSISPFIRNKLNIMYETSTFEELLLLIEENEIISPGFFVKYMELVNDDPHIKKRKYYCKEIGFKINSFPSFKNPKTTFGVICYEKNWYFGVLITNNSKWKDHNNKPFSYSSSLGINLAKVLVNVASNGDYSKKIIDPCCGVGTVLLEGLFAGYNIEGREINEKVADSAKGNLLHYNYDNVVTTGDIKDITKNYDVSIIDLPYGIFSHANTDNQKKIISNAKRISKKIILVSSVDIKEDISNQNLIIIDYCKVSKSKNFARHIWVCK